MATRTKGKVAKKPEKAQPPTHAEALDRVLTQAAISMADLSVLMGVHVSTLQRKASEEKNELPFPTLRIGQRWVIPSAPVRAALGIGQGAA